MKCKRLSLLRGGYTVNSIWPYRCHFSSAHHNIHSCSTLTTQAKMEVKTCSTCKRECTEFTRFPYSTPTCYSLPDWHAPLAFPRAIAHYPCALPYARPNTLRYGTFARRGLTRLHVTCPAIGHGRTGPGSTMLVCDASSATSLIQHCSAYSLRIQR